MYVDSRSSDLRRFQLNERQKWEFRRSTQTGYTDPESAITVDVIHNGHYTFHRCGSIKMRYTD